MKGALQIFEVQVEVYFFTNSVYYRIKVNDNGQTSALTVRVNDDYLMINLFEVPVDTYDVLSRWKIRRA